MYKIFLRLFIIFIFITPAWAEQAPQLIIESDMGADPIIRAIQQAKTSVDLVMYGLTDAPVINALIQAKNQGKKVRVLLQHFPYKAENENKFAIERLQAQQVNLEWADGDFKLTHQKTLLIDGQMAMVMTFNLTHMAFKNERNFALVVTDPALVQEIQQVFNADWQHKAITVHQPDLIWSPDNSREKILNIIDSAKTDLKIYAQSLSDYQVVGALARAAKSGVNVQVLTSTMTNKFHSKQLDYLTRSGVQIRFSKSYLIHAKVIVVDHTRAVIGSINFTRSSINNNRELAVITYNPTIINKLENIFNSDWENTSLAKITHAHHSFNHWSSAIREFDKQYGRYLRK
jgi:cardiolipin synthase